MGVGLKVLPSLEPGSPKFRKLVGVFLFQLGAGKPRRLLLVPTREDPSVSNVNSWLQVIKCKQLIRMETGFSGPVGTGEDSYVYIPKA